MRTSPTNLHRLCRASRRKLNRLLNRSLLTKLLIWHWLPYSCVGKWTDAVPLIERWIKTVEIESVSAKWDDFGPMFRDSFQTGHAAPMAEFIERTAPRHSVWSTIAEALRDCSKQADLARLPNELSVAAAELVRQFRGEIKKINFPGDRTATPDDTGIL